MNQAAVRPYAAVGVALLGAGLIGVIPAIWPAVSNIHPQSHAVELASTADAFDVLANALDPSASTDGLLSIANSLDSFLDEFGNPTVNVADTLATDFVTDLGVGNEVGTVDGDLNAGFALLDTDLGALSTALTSGLDTLGTDLGNLGIGDLDTDLTNLGTELTNLLGSGGVLDTELGQIGKDIVGIDTDLDQGFRNLFDALSTDLSPLSTISTELSNTGILAGDLSEIYNALLVLIGEV
jgi:hypothetical protein